MSRSNPVPAGPAAPRPRPSRSRGAARHLPRTVLLVVLLLLGLLGTCMG
jgi:hypothetical protein